MRLPLQETINRIKTTSTIGVEESLCCLVTWKWARRSLSVVRGFCLEDALSLVTVGAQPLSSVFSFGAAEARSIHKALSPGPLFLTLWRLQWASRSSSAVLGSRLQQQPERSHGAPAGTDGCWLSGREQQQDALEPSLQTGVFTREMRVALLSGKYPWLIWNSRVDKERV